MSKKKKTTKTFSAPDGTTWLVEASSPGASNAMIRFRHPDGGRSGMDRYNWFLWNGPEARSVTARLDSKNILEHVDDATLATLFRRSMPITTINPPPDILPADQ